jgi:hypothetical protein
VPVLSARAYARTKGVSHTAVQKAIRTGRLSTLPDGKIDSVVADREWDENRQIVVERPQQRPQERESPPPRSAPPSPRPAQEEQDAPPTPVPGVGSQDYAKARAIKENYNARLAKIQYEEKIGKLVNSDEVAVAAFNKGRILRDVMLGLPDRLAAILAAEMDEAKVHDLLDTEIRAALTKFADAATHSE